MIKHQAKLGIVVTISSSVLIFILVILSAKFSLMRDLVFTMLGPLAIMALFVGIFLLIAGLMKKEELKKE